ncbi:hypothetical protein WN943_028428 [Citrus x changshan-huyou]
MDPEELIRRCRAIKLSDEEEGRVSFKSQMKATGEKIVAGCLIGKVLHTRGVSIEGLKSVMQRVWRTSREVKIEGLGDNVFMFKFGTEADKRSILMGGPWHFDRALIVLTEPAGIGDVKKQKFNHVSFWVQIHDVLIMCMSKEMALELGNVIGKVEEIETDATREYFGQFLRLRISVDVMKPLKKLIELEQEGENEEDIPMRVMYERLPDFCFCCGRICHQYRECVHYKSQSKDEMPYGPWLKALTITEKLKQGRRKDRWDSDIRNNHQNALDPIKRAGENDMMEKDQQNGGVHETEYGFNRPEWDSGMGLLSGTRSMDQLGTGKQLMKEATKTAEPAASRNVSKNQAEGGAVLWEMDKEAGTIDGKEKEWEVNLQHNKSIKMQNVGLTKAGKGEREENVRKDSIEGGNHKLNMNTCSHQMESEVENGENGLRMDKPKPKKNKWKFQARNVEGNMETNEEVMGLKRLNSTMNWENPKLKKCKRNSPQIMGSNQRPGKALAIEGLNFENVEEEDRGDFENAGNEKSAVAGKQPHRQP